MPKYTVVFVSYGHIDVDAEDKNKAIDLAYQQSTWDDFGIPEYVRVEEIENA